GLGGAKIKEPKANVGGVGGLVNWGGRLGGEGMVDTSQKAAWPKRRSSMARKERVSATLCAVALLLSAGLGNATDIDAKSFRCIRKMTPVRQFYVDNLRGNLDATLAVANSTTGGVYPPGSVIQLIPGEVMVKRDNGFNAATHDWEFFELDVSKDGTQIRKRGTVDVVNRFWRELLWLSRCSCCAVGSRVRNWPRLRSAYGDARDDWCSAKDGSPLRQCPNKPGGCRSAQTTGAAAEGAWVKCRRNQITPRGKACPTVSRSMASIGPSMSTATLLSCGCCATC